MKTGRVNSESHLIKADQWGARVPKFLKQPLVYHSLFWIFYFTFNVIRWGSYHQDYLYAIKANLIEFPLHMALAYFNIYYLIPKLLPKRYISYIILILAGVATAVMGRVVLESAFQVYPNEPPYVGIMYLAELGVGEIYVQAFITAFKFLLDWGKQQRRTRQLERKNFETELNFLRSQIQPHFFFNTLNNLYSLTLDKSDLAPKTVLKLSDLMSYVIYEGKQKKVPLSRELSYIKNYLDLEQLRFGSKIKTRFQVHGEVTDQQVAPLLLLPFIENSFKHGVGDGKKPVEIFIDLEIHPQEILFTVQNQKLPTLRRSSQPYHHIGHNGVGVENIKRRLELIYGESFHLEIKNEPTLYTVKLKIPTHEYQVSHSG